GVVEVELLHLELLSEALEHGGADLHRQILRGLCDASRGQDCGPIPAMLLSAASTLTSRLPTSTTYRLRPPERSRSTWPSCPFAAPCAAATARDSVIFVCGRSCLPSSSEPGLT